MTPTISAGKLGSAAASISRGLDDTPEKKHRFDAEVDYMKRTWGELLAADPAYNTNLSLEIEGMQLAWPPRTQVW